MWTFLGALLALVGLVTSRRRGSQPAAPVRGGAAAGGDLPSTSRPPPGAQPPPAAAGDDRKVEPDKLVFDLVPPGEPTAWANLTYEHCDAHPLQACAKLPDYFEAHTASRSHLFAPERNARIFLIDPRDGAALPPNTMSTATNTYKFEDPNHNQAFWVTTWPDGSPESDDGQLRGVGTRTANSFTLNGWIVSGSENVTDGDPCDGHVTTPSRCVAAIAGVERHSPYYHSGDYRYPTGYKLNRGVKTDEPRIAGGTIVLTCEFGMGTSTGGLPGQKGSCTGIYNWTTPTEDIIWVDDGEEPIDPLTKARAKDWEFPNMRDLVLDKCFRVLDAQDIEDIRSQKVPGGKPRSEMFLLRNGKPSVKAGDLLTMDCPESEDLVPGQG